MEISFNLTKNIDKYWEKFIEKLWSYSDLIKIIYTNSIGSILIELNLKNEYKVATKVKHSIYINDLILNETILCKAVENVIKKYKIKKFFTIPDNLKKNNILENDNKNCYLIDDLNNKELKISFQKEITTYFHYYLPLCIILSDKRFIPWFYEHFIQICLRINKLGIFFEKNYATIDYLENKLLFSDIAYISNFGYKASESICLNGIDYIINKINSGYYITIFLDEFYISSKEVYNAKHYVHQSLIYGYNSEEKTFFSIGLNKFNVLTKLKLKFEEFNEAFINARFYYKYSALWSEHIAIQLFKLKEFYQYPEFHLEIFNKKLKDYIYSRGSIKNVHNYNKGEKFIYGFKIYNKLKLYLKYLKKNINKIDYRAFHILYEQKNAIYGRLQYIANKYQLDYEFLSLIQEFSNIVKSFNALRLNILKQCVKKWNTYFEMYKLSMNDNFLNRTITFIEQNTIKEKIILKKIYNYLKKLEINRNK